MTKNNKMYIILAVQGCFPFIEILCTTNGMWNEAMFFKTKKKASAFARENCAWEYKIVEW